MEIGVSLPEDDVDAPVGAPGVGSRPAVGHKAERLRSASALGPAYEDAWRQWAEAGEAEAWDRTVGDGLADTSQ